jgi:transcriptional regulator with XRE-family HTH domain
MVTSINKIAKNLAENITQLRKKKNMTQSQLADLSGATRASIALIESGSSNPTLEVLLKLSQALQVSLDELMTPARAECLFIAADDVPTDRRTKKGLRIRKILPDKMGATEIDEILLDADCGFTGTPHVEGTKEYFTCIEGEMTITVMGESYVLKTGDVFTFPGDKSHSYKNAGRSKARGMSVVLFNPF